MNLVGFWLLSTYFVVVSCECNFSKSDIEKTLALFAVKENDQYELLLDGAVGDGTIVQLICPKGKPHQGNPTASLLTSLTCSKNAFDRNLGKQQCSSSVAVTVEPLADDTCNGTMYGVGYKVGRQFVELYRTCYNRAFLRTVFTRHTIHPFKWYMRRPKKSFDTHGIISLQEARSFSNAAVYEQLNKLFNFSQNYMTARNQNLISRGHLVRSADYLHESNRNATFTYINVTPQFSSINAGIWAQIEKFVKNETIRQDSELTIVTGTSDEVLELPDRNNNLVEIYLLSDKRNPIPRWMYKVVANGTRKVVFLTANNVFLEQRPPSYCVEVKCPPQVERNLRKYRGEKNYKAMGVTYCCDPKTFGRHFKHLENII